MKPYYAQSGITIYHGDCLDVSPSLGCFDLLLTDPPYGIGEGTGRHLSRNRVPGPDYFAADWDFGTQDERVDCVREQCKYQIIFGGNYYELPPSSCWLVWDKDNTGDFADCELAWTNLRKAVRKITYRWNGMLQQPGRPKEKRQHPTQKPEPVMVWALQHAPPDVRTVLDPFMGSGTTLVAAKRLGKSAVGIELDERYCEMAAQRLQQEALPMEFTA
jgi:DNA modification methylase